MYSLFVHDLAKEDLESLWETEEEVAATVEALLQELKADQKALESLTDHGFGADRSKPFSVSKWQELWRQKKDIWRIRSWALESLGHSYRIIYCYQPSTLSYYVLSIIHRDFDYDTSDPRVQRILDAYDDL